MTSPFDSARAALVSEMPAHFDRLRMSSGELHQLRTRRLRDLLALAVERSPFHARRLTGVDPATFEIADLPSLPPMHKADMMAAFDEVVTDRRLNLGGVERHLAGLASGASLHLDEYVVMASGGSSGCRGVYAYHLTAATEFIAAVLRPGLAQMSAVLGWPPPAPAPLAIVAAPVCVHPTRILPVLAEGRIAEVTYAPATLHFDEIVERVQQCQPLVLTGYATTIARLADARAAGQLAIDPHIVQVTSEQLTADLEARITAGFGSPPVNSFASTEGLIGAAPPGAGVFDFASDLAIVEYVDAEDRPVPAGSTAHHVLVTNLFNATQPLVRYRMDDTMTPAPPSSDHGHQRATLQGRCDEHLELGGASVHPLTIRSLMVRTPEVADFQVRSDGQALEVDLVLVGGADRPALPALIAEALAEALAAAGAGPVPVVARCVPAIERDRRTGKARRFVNH